MWLYDRFVDALASLAVLLLLAIMLGIGADVAARYFFNQPIGWMLEFVQHSLLSILFLGLAWLTREGGHVSIEILVDAVPPGMRRILLFISVLIAGATSGFIGAWALYVTIDNYQRGVETIGIYPIPRSLLTGVIALGLVLTAIEFFRRAATIIVSPESASRPRDELKLEP